jgi:hypothetical protein
VRDTSLSGWERKLGSRNAELGKLLHARVQGHKAKTNRILNRKFAHSLKAMTADPFGWPRGYATLSRSHSLTIP